MLGKIQDNRRNDMAGNQNRQPGRRIIGTDFRQIFMADGACRIGRYIGFENLALAAMRTQPANTPPKDAGFYVIVLFQPYPSGALLSLHNIYIAYIFSFTRNKKKPLINRGFSVFSRSAREPYQPPHKIILGQSGPASSLWSMPRRNPAQISLVHHSWHRLPQSRAVRNSNRRPDQQVLPSI